MNPTVKPVYAAAEFTREGDIKLTESACVKIRKHFMVFAMNRTNFVNQCINEKRLNRQKIEAYSHMPQLDENSRKIVKKFHSQLSELNIPHYELLLYKGKEYEKRREMNICKKNIGELESDNGV